MTLDPWQWLLAALAALIIGFSKTGIGGLSLLAVALVTQLFPGETKRVSGLILPLLIIGDLVAVGSYRRHVQWKFLWKLFPWTALGVLIGWLAMGRIDNRQASVLVGVIIVAMVGLHVWRRQAGAGAPMKTAPESAHPAAAGAAAQDASTQANRADAHSRAFAPTMGVLAGFTTLIANAAGPLMAIYLLAMRLPKMEFMGTGAVFFMILNWFKVPFMVDLGLITGDSIFFNLLVAPAVIVGALAGRELLPRVNQRLFENLALILSAAAGVKMILAG
jgi:uncharacterized protein